jgi:transposase-like protein
MHPNDKKERACSLRELQGHSYEKIAKELGVSRSTVFRWIIEYEAQVQNGTVSSENGTVSSENGTVPFSDETEWNNGLEKKVLEEINFLLIQSKKELAQISNDAKKNLLKLQNEKRNVFGEKIKLGQQKKAIEQTILNGIETQKNQELKKAVSRSRNFKKLLKSIEEGIWEYSEVEDMLATAKVLKSDLVQLCYEKEINQKYHTGLKLIKEVITLAKELIEEMDTDGQSEIELALDADFLIECQNAHLLNLENGRIMPRSESTIGRHRLKRKKRRKIS